MSFNFQNKKNDDQETRKLFINQQTKQEHHEGKQQDVVNQGKRYNSQKKLNYRNENQTTTQQIIMEINQKCEKLMIGIILLIKIQKFNIQLLNNQKINNNNSIIFKLKKFLVYIMDIKYKYNHYEQNPNMKSLVENRREPLLEKYGESLLLQGAEKDALQKNWFFRPPLLISHMRPISTDDRKYILVEKPQLQNNIESEMAIQKEIRRIKMSQGIILNEDEEESIMEKLKQQDYAQYKRLQMNKQYEHQKIIDNRYDQTNQHRSSNTAADIVDQYLLKVKDELKTQQQRQDQERIARQH